MERKTIRESYAPIFKSLFENSVAAPKIDPTNVYQTANKKNRAFIDKLVEDNLQEGSCIANKENFLDFYNAVKGGKSGLILMEHYSNTDLPTLTYMLEHSGDANLADLSGRIVAVAGMKLNEDDPIVRAFAESFTRVVIYPTRSLKKKEQEAESEEQVREEAAAARRINLAAMRAMDRCKKRGEVILVFPAGTRYRKGQPETKRGLREIDSYLRLFDIAILVSANGALLEIQEGREDMLSDLITPSKVVIAASNVIECKPFRTNFLASLPADTEDPKQCMVDHVMSLLESQHNKIAAELS